MSSVEAGSSSSAGPSSGKAKAADRLAKLRELQLKRNEARKLNHKEVVEEDRRNKLPGNWDAKKQRLDWEDEEESRKKECKEQGKDFDREKVLDIRADQAEKWDRKKKAKQNPDTGFADFEQATFRQYQRLTKQMKPDMQDYEREKDKMGEASFYPSKNTLGVEDHKDSQDSIDRMVTDLEKQIDKRSKYSRRRAYDPDEDIDYINERNMKFNKKLERFYGQYTSEIKKNLERGTAV